MLNSCAYYNTFFNAKKYFAEAQEIPLRDTGRPDSNAIKKYNKCIKKCGIILTDYKESEWADDALILLAKSLFYKKSNYIQAKEKFNDMITFYPDSEFADEAHLYIARSDFELKNKEEAFEQLKEIISNPELQNIHSETMFVTAEYYLQENEHIQAEYYFKRIIDEFPESEEYEQAYIALSESYHKSENYQLSNETISELLQNKKVGKKAKLDARYIYAYNLLLSGEYQEALKASKKLLSNEYRLNELPKTQLLEARSMDGVGNTEKAIKRFETIMQENQRSKYSAEAAFYLGELYFNSVHDYEKAIEFYNKVRTEFNKTEFKKSALTRSVAAGRIIQYNNPDRNMSIQELTDEYFKLAEFYLEDLVIPDSALMVYNTVISQVSFLETKTDSLRIAADNYWLPDSTVFADSLAFSDSLSISDSLIISEDEVSDFPVLRDSVSDTEDLPKSELKLIGESRSLLPVSNDSQFVNKPISDSLVLDEMPAITDTHVIVGIDSLNLTDSATTPEQHEIPDSLKLIQKNVIINDSLDISVPVLDTLILAEEETDIIVPEETVVDSTEYKLLLNQVRTSEYELALYNTEIIPLANLMKVWTYKKVLKDSVQASQILEEMTLDFPDNKYTNAAVSIMNNTKINLISTKEMRETLQFDNAMENYESNTQQTIINLKIIAEDKENTFYVKSLYTLGYLNFYAMQDTTVAKQYFDEVLNIYGTTEYSNEVRKIYDGNKFGKLDRLPAIVAIENEKAVEEEERIKEEEKAIQDMKKEEAKSKEKKEPEKEKDKSDKEQN